MVLRKTKQKAMGNFPSSYPSDEERGSSSVQDDPKKKKFEANVNVDTSNTLSVVEEVVDVCKDFSGISQIKTLGKNTNSESGQVLGLLSGKKVFLKIFNDQALKKQGNGLLVEAAIYFCAIAKLIPRSCPFFIQPLAYQECDGFLNRLAKKSGDPYDISDRKEIEQILSRFDDGPMRIPKQDVPKYRQNLHPLTERSYIIINEQLNFNSAILPYDMTMHQWFQTAHSLESYKAIFFQVFWTLLCMEKIGLRHNDLHTGNIFVRKFPQKMKYSFVFYYSGNFKIINLESEYMILVFDFDRGTLVGITDNSSLDTLCKWGYGCQNDNYGYDVTRMVCYLEITLRYLNNQPNLYPNVAPNDTPVAKTLNFLKQFVMVNGQDLSSYRDPDTCAFYPKKSLKGNLTNTLQFKGQEIALQFDYTKILATDPFFESIRNDKKDLSQISESKTYSLPTEQIKSEIESCVRKNFPSILCYKSPPKDIIV